MPLGAIPQPLCTVSAPMSAYPSAGMSSPGPCNRFVPFLRQCQGQIQQLIRMATVAKAPDSGTPFIPAYPSFRRIRHSDLSVIPAYPSFRLIRHPGVPVIPTYPSSRRTRHSDLPVIPAYPSSRRTRHSGASRNLMGVEINLSSSVTISRTAKRAECRKRLHGGTYS